jgi:hypothetical protein
MIDMWRIGKDLEGSDRGLIEMLSRYLPVGTEKNHENFLDSWSLCSDGDSNRTLPDLESGELMLRQPTWLLIFNVLKNERWLELLG